MSAKTTTACKKTHCCVTGTSGEERIERSDLAGCSQAKTTTDYLDYV